jgi:hypothetical protein
MPTPRRCDICLGWLDGDVIRDATHLFSVEHERSLRAHPNFKISAQFYRDARAEFAADKKHHDGKHAR